MRRRGYGKRRAAVLAGVYVLMALHIAHWKISGRTLAPLELNEVMYTLELGIVTAGFLLMVLAVVSVLIFGRFFCSWGCHILALEDLCAWLLARIGIRPRPVRSRILLLVPPGAMLYMFAWPQVTRLWRGSELGNLHVASDDGPWASFVTDDFWRNLPGPWVALLTFAIVGFAIVYVLGSRAFCTYGCPYGALFALADRVAPGRIVANDDCTSCGRCTEVCQSDVLVHEEIRRYKQIVDPACLKDLDCVAECPSGALRFGFTTPARFRGARPARRTRRYDFTPGEDLVMAGVLVASIAIFRGLYGVMPFLTTLAIGAIVAFGSVALLRLLRRSRVSLRGVLLKTSGRITKSGAIFLSVALPAAALVAHSAFIRYHEWRGAQAFEEVQVARAERRPQDYRRLHTLAVRHFELCNRYGLVRPLDLDRRLAALHYAGPDARTAEPYLRRIVAAVPSDLDARLRLAYLAIRSGRLADASGELDQVLVSLSSADPGDPQGVDQVARALEALAGALEATGRAGEADTQRESAARLRSGAPQE